MLNKKALAGTPSTPPVFVEDVFSTYLWDGNSTARNIVNGIDLAGKGGLVWTKYRNAENHHRLYDTARGATKEIYTSLTNAEATSAQSLTAFNSDGFSLGTGQPNETTATVVGWTFRKQAKFFDVVTYTGNDTARTIAHSLGSTPGMMIIKSTSAADNWVVYHRSLGETNRIFLNLTNASATAATTWNNTAPTSTNFTLGTSSAVNADGVTYVAYLFAHDAGGFGSAGTDNIISCGSFTTDGSGNFSVNLGYEPQFIIARRSSATDNWWMWDNMRGFSQTSLAYLYPNLSSAEFVSTSSGIPKPNATGFSGVSDASSTFIYMAIRRPMKTPTTGTEVFKPTVFTGVDTAQTAGFPVDLVMNAENISSTTQWQWVDRLRGANKKLESNATSAEGTVSDGLWDSNTQVRVTSSGNNYKRLYPMFRRATGFFDIVCYTGTGSNTTVTHNLGVAPELMIVRPRSTTAAWRTYVASIGATWQLALNEASAAENINSWNSTAPTASVFSVSGGLVSNGTTYVAYLFATCAGVSKVGSYTGTGTTQTINCGFSSGARFVMIKRKDDSGDWYIWDTARGIVSGDDPYLLLNDTAAEVTNTDYIDPVNSGFELSSTAPAAINANGGSFIFMAIA